LLRPASHSSDTPAEPIVITGAPGWANVSIVSDPPDQVYSRDWVPAQATMYYCRIIGGSGRAIKPRDVAGKNTGWIEWRAQQPSWKRHGGGVLVAGADVEMRHSSVLHCTADLGGGVQCRAAGKVTIEDCVVEHNAARHGGGFFLYHANPDLIDNEVRDNRAAGEGGCGGGIYCGTNARARIEKNVIQRNQATVGGGGVYALQSEQGQVAEASERLRITGNTIIENRVNGSLALHHNHGGGGIRCDVGSSPMIDANLIADNHVAKGYGGGCYFESFPWHVAQNTVKGNTALDGEGGGYYVDTKGAREQLQADHRRHLRRNMGEDGVDLLCRHRLYRLGLPGATPPLAQ
jgi:hypothetical protein